MGLRKEIVIQKIVATFWARVASRWPLKSEPVKALPAATNVCCTHVDWQARGAFGNVVTGGVKTTPEECIFRLEGGEGASTNDVMQKGGWRVSFHDQHNIFFLNFFFLNFLRVELWSSDVTGFFPFLIFFFFFYII